MNLVRRETKIQTGIRGESTDHACDHRCVNEEAFLVTSLSPPMATTDPFLRETHGLE